jgi:hypothetical protein
MPASLRPFDITLSLRCGEQKRQNAAQREILGKFIADNLSKAGWSWGCVSAIDSSGRTIWIADAHRDDEKRIVVRPDEKLSAFLELESAIRARPAVGWQRVVRQWRELQSRWN